MESATSGALSTEQPLSGRLSVELSEENTSRLTRLVSAVPVQDVELEEDEVVMRMSLGFNRRPRTAAGDPLQNGTLVFDPQQIEGAPAFAPTEQLLDLTRFAYPVSGLMYGAKVSGVDVQKDRLILSGEVRKKSRWADPGRLITSAFVVIFCRWSPWRGSRTTWPAVRGR